MEKIQWKYVSPLSDSHCFEDLETKYDFKFPGDLKDCILHNNAGIPSKSCFDLKSEQNKVFGGLLSFNKGEPDNVYDYIALFSKKKMIPFGTDPAGNFFCLKDEKIIFYDHELDSVTELADSFTNFLEILY